MVFSSVFFLFCFLPVFLGIYYITPFKHRSWVILLGSYAFYAWWRVDFLLLFIGVTLWNYLFGIYIARSRNQKSSTTNKAKPLLVVAIIGNLSTLGYFKYADFGINNLNLLLNKLGASPLPLADIILPIGISFYTFQAISYVVDVYRGDTPPTKRLVDFAAFIALFPQLIAGPVLRYKDLADQFEHREHNIRIFSEGSCLFMIGFAKKVLIADSVAPIANAAFNTAAISSFDAWIGAFAYSIQLYFDFSGYSDMACGLGLMMGFRFIQNFDHPYVSLSITEFWRRWHISLSTWLRDYLYIPLGGNRGGKITTYRNLFLTMLLGGLWHGANWTFVFWGALHGTALAIEKMFSATQPSSFRLLRYVVTMFIVIIGWIAFRADDLSIAVSFYQSMLGIHDAVPIGSTFGEINTRSFIFLIAALLIVALENMKRQNISLIPQHVTRYAQPVLLLPIFVMAVSKLVASNYSPFLYFQF
ncbi:MBOAT family protein [Vibrio sp. 404]|uniref:Probable alginate O-acetylase n=1 Tax=Vibrio marinisediminis TaxID=2758441 RepID=A0A7W2FUA9_9VIBR|nr:MBOAT family protein [Vibrio marinisediminis]MBA5764367.1 MBOAT family protein [Vibrio marinisediminis]